MIYKALFKIKTQEIPRFLLAVKKKKPFKRMRDGAAYYPGMMRTVQLNCPIKAEIRAVDSQSDLQSLYSFVIVIVIIIITLLLLLLLL